MVTEVVGNHIYSLKKIITLNHRKNFTKCTSLKYPIEIVYNVVVTY